MNVFVFNTQRITSVVDIRQILARFLNEPIKVLGIDPEDNETKALLQTGSLKTEDTNFNFFPLWSEPNPIKCILHLAKELQTPCFWEDDNGIFLADPEGNLFKLAQDEEGDPVFSERQLIQPQAA
jgi:hypothetical protein